MKLIFMARKALAAYFASSALSRLVNMTGALPKRQRLVEPLHHFAGAGVVIADEHAIGMGEVLDGRALAQELGVRADGDIGVGPERLQPPLDLAAGADGNGRLGGDDREAVEVRRDILDRLEDIGEVGMAIAAAHRRADGEEDDVGVGHRRPELGREDDAPGLQIAGEQRVEARLVDRHLALEEPGDARLVLVDAGDTPAELGEAGRRDEPDIARADHADVERHRPSAPSRREVSPFDRVRRRAGQGASWRVAGVR